MKISSSKNSNQMKISKTTYEHLPYELRNHIIKIRKNDYQNAGQTADNQGLFGLAHGVITADKKQNQTLRRDGNGKQSQGRRREPGIVPVEFSSA